MNIDEIDALAKEAFFDGGPLRYPSPDERAIQVSFRPLQSVSLKSQVEPTKLRRAVASSGANPTSALVAITLTLSLLN